MPTHITHTFITKLLCLVACVNDYKSETNSLYSTDLFLRIRLVSMTLINAKATPTNDTN